MLPVRFPLPWAERDWYLGPHRSVLFDRAGNAGPTVWWDGRIVGGWTQRPDGEIVWRLLDDIGADGRRAVEQTVERLQAWLEGTVVVARFPTPVHEQLRG